MFPRSSFDFWVTSIFHVSESSSCHLLADFEKEISVHKTLTKHSNVVSMLGYCTDRGIALSCSFFLYFYGHDKIKCSLYMFHFHFHFDVSAPRASPECPACGSGHLGLPHRGRPWEANRTHPSNPRSLLLYFMNIITSICCSHLRSFLLGSWIPPWRKPSRLPEEEEVILEGVKTSWL